MRRWPQFLYPILFLTENVNFIYDPFFPKVTGLVKNMLEKDVEDLKVNAVLYDAQNNIIGGGYSYLDYIPAGGLSAVDVSVETGSVVDHVELYATMSGLITFSD